MRRNIDNGQEIGMKTKEIEMGRPSERTSIRKECRKSPRESSVLDLVMIFSSILRTKGDDQDCR